MMSRPLYSFCKSVLYFSVLFLISCVDQPSTAEKEKTAEVFLQILGTVQDGGSPHAGCKKPCCQNLFDKPDPTRMVVSIILGYLMRVRILRGSNAFYITVYVRCMVKIRMAFLSPTRTLGIMPV
jgi:hypothetical protein